MYNHGLTTEGTGEAMKMKIRPVNVFGDPIPDVTAKKVAEPGEGALRIKIGAPGHLHDAASPATVRCMTFARPRRTTLL